MTVLSNLGLPEEEEKKQQIEEPLKAVPTPLEASTKVEEIALGGTWEFRVDGGEVGSMTLVHEPGADTFVGDSPHGTITDGLIKGRNFSYRIGPYTIDGKIGELGDTLVECSSKKDDIQVMTFQAIKAVEVDDVWTIADDLLPDIKKAVGIGFPLMLSGMIKMIMGLFTSVMIGRRATLLLASVSAAAAWTEPIDDFTRAFGLQVAGLGTQAIGAGNLSLTGVWCQMSLILVVFVSIPVLFLKMLTGPMLIFLGVSAHLADPAGHFATMVSYTTVIELWSICVWGFVISRGDNRPDMIVSMSLLVIFFVILYFLVHVWEVELFGLACLTATRRVVHLVFLVVLTKYMGFFEKAYWRTPSVKELFQKHRWIVLLSQALPGAFDMSLQKANGAVTVALAARIGVGESAAFDVLTQMSGCIFTFCWGISCGFSIVMGTRLGAGQPNRAKGIFKAGCIFVYPILFTFAVVLYINFDLLAIWVSKDPIVQENVRALSGMSCCSIVLSGGMYLMNECLCKQGRVYIIMWTMPPILWLIGSPISILLAPSMGIPGIMWGNVASSTTGCAALAIHVYLSDWEEIVRVIRVRAEVAPIDFKKEKAA